MMTPSQHIAAWERAKALRTNPPKQRDLIPTLQTRNACWFVDPPYTASKKAAGNRLYRQNELDHAELWDLIAEAEGPAMFTYDNAPEIREMANQHGFRITRCQMKSTHHAEVYELVVLKP